MKIETHCTYDKLVPLAKLKPHPRNPNKHPDAQIELLAKILEAQGWRNPIVVSKRSGFIVNGHGRMLAAQKLGLTEAPVNFQAFKSEAQELAHLVSDNKIAELAETDDETLKALITELSKTDLDMALLGLGDAEMQRLLAEINPPAPDDDHAAELVDKAAELQKTWKTEPGQVWELGDHRLMCGDSTSKEDVGRLMGSDKAVLCFTSPPYAQQRDYTKQIENWDKLMQGVFGQLRMEDAGQVLVNLGLIHKNGEWLEYWRDWVLWMKQQGWKSFGWYVWDQGDALPGHWQGRFGPSHEFVFHFTKRPIQPVKWVACKTAGKLNDSGSALKSSGSGKSNVWATNATKIPDSVIRVNRARADETTSAHPAIFPVPFASHFVKSWIGLVYEPFSGSGTTLIACEQLNRRCRAMEISPAYVAVALQRWADLTHKTPKLLK